MSYSFDFANGQARVVIDATAAEMQTNYAAWKPRGYRIKSLSVYGPANNLRYTAIWMKVGEPNEWAAYFDLKAGSQQDLFRQAQASLGRVTTILSATKDEQHSARFAEVFEYLPDVEVLIEQEKFFTAVQDLKPRDQSYQLAWITTYGQSEGELNFAWCATVWHRKKDKKARSVVPWNLMAAPFQTDPNAPHPGVAMSAPLLEAKLNTVLVAETERHETLTIWREDNLGEQRLSHSRRLYELLSDISKYEQEGFFPVRIDAAGGYSFSVPTKGPSPGLVHHSAVYMRAPQLRYRASLLPSMKPPERTWEPTAGKSVPGCVELDDYVKTLMMHYGIPQAQLAVVRNKVLVYNRAYTYYVKDRPWLGTVEPTTLLNQFRIGSISKTLTAIAIMQLLSTSIRAALIRPSTRGYRRCST